MAFPENVVAGVSAGRDLEWGHTYRNHPVVRANPGEPVLPLALYVDGMPFTKNDGMVAFYMYSLISGARYLIAILRKSHMCQCGCRHWSSHLPMLHFIHWSLATMAEGVFPRFRPDGSPWVAADGARFTMAGQPLAARGALVMVKGDWAEFAQTFGFASWASTLAPCMACKCTATTMYDVTRVSLLSLPWSSVTSADYDLACSACERHVVVSAPQHRTLRAILRYDKRRSGAGGRALLDDFPALGLLKGDRLEPTPSLPDIGAFDSITTFPCPLLFWRKANETRARRRNPLLDDNLGIGIAIFCFDTLHTLNLGSAKSWRREAIWRMIESDIWQLGDVTQEERLALSVLRLKAVLWPWYARQRDLHGRDSVHAVEDIAPKMLGSSASHKLNTKAAETKTLLFFVVDFLRQHVGTVLGGPPLLAAGEALVDLFNIMDRSPRQMEPTAMQGLMDATKRYRVMLGKAAPRRTIC